MNEFKVGDIVRLISGGPDMAVTEVTEVTEETPPKEVKGTPPWSGHTNKSKVKCEWTDKNKPYQRSYPPEALEKISTEKE